jgi:MFS transporter, FHS family, L-fucose permease
MTHKKSTIFSLTIICILFFCFGFITWMNGVLIPFFKICLELNNFQASLVMFASFSPYFIMALPSSMILKKTGYRKGMVMGLAVMAVGTTLFIPAAYSRNYVLFLFGIFLTGTGLTILQAAANPYVAIIGPIESTAQRIGFMGVSNKMAGIFSIMVLGSIFLFNADEISESIKAVDTIQKAKILDEYALKVITPYTYITLALLLLGVMIYFSGLPEISDSETLEPNDLTINDTRTSVLQYPNLVLGIFCIFFASACETIPVDSLIIYGRSLGMSMEQARQYPIYTLMMMLVGYLSSIVLIPRYLSQQRALQYASIWGILLAIIAYFAGGLISVYCLILMGVGSAILWGTIWGLALKHLGEFTKTGSALLLMGIIGGAILPPLFGILIDKNPLTPQNAILIIIPFYLYLLFYGIKGFAMKKWTI